MHNRSHYVPSFQVIRFNALAHFQTSLLTSLFFSAAAAAVAVIALSPHVGVDSRNLRAPRRSSSQDAITPVPLRPVCPPKPPSARAGYRRSPPLAAAAAVARAAALGRRAAMLRTVLAGA